MIVKRLMKCRLIDDGFKPEKGHMSDAGWDLKTPMELYIAPDDSVIVDTKVCFEIPEGYVGFIKSKSGLNVKRGIQAEGVIDSGYTGSVVVKLYNHGVSEMRFHKGDKIAQIVFLPILAIDDMLYVNEFPKTERGENGFGSTGR